MGDECPRPNTWFIGRPEDKLMETGTYTRLTCSDIGQQRPEHPELGGRRLQQRQLTRPSSTSAMVLLKLNRCRCFSARETGPSRQLRMPGQPGCRIDLPNCS